MIVAIKERTSVDVQLCVITYDHFVDLLFKEYLDKDDPPLIAPKDSVLNKFGNGLLKSIASVFNTIQDIETKAHLFPDVDPQQASTYRTVKGTCELLELVQLPVAEVRSDTIDATKYIVLYTSTGMTHSLGVLRTGDYTTIFFRNHKFEMPYLAFKHMCLHAADTATLVYFLFEPAATDRMYDLSPLLNMTCV